MLMVWARCSSSLDECSNVNLQLQTVFSPGKLIVQREKQTQKGRRNTSMIGILVWLGCRIVVCGIRFQAMPTFNVITTSKSASDTESGEHYNLAYISQLYTCLIFLSNQTIICAEMKEGSQLHAVTFPGYLSATSVHR